MKKVFHSAVSLIAVLMLCFMALAGCSSGDAPAAADPTDTSTREVSANPVTPATEPATEPPSSEPETENAAPVTVSLVAVGDMLMHTSASNPALMADGSYNYDYLFANVKDAIQSADIAVVNNEVIMGGNDKGNIGYPAFNVRTELGDAEVSAGFDVVLHASNHAIDQGAGGILNCLEYWNGSHPDTAVLGIHNSAENASQIYVRDVKGIKIAMLNYTYGLNGLEVPEGMEYTVDIMTDATKDKIASDIARAKEISDFVIVYPHWGTEYNLAADESQNSWAGFFAENGVDLVIGTHPHVIEPVQWIDRPDGGRMLVYYSLGNFVSVQYYNFSMLGGMAKVSITKDASGTYISDYDMDFLVTHYTAGRSVITTYFLDDYTDELASQHAILFEPSDKYMQVNQGYSFNIAGLRAIAKSVCPEFAQDY